MTTIYLVRHGEVFNPTGIIYGRLPGFGLSEKGRTQLAQAAELLAGEAPFAALYASPMQRAQESAAILAKRLGLEILTDDRILETDVSGYQGKRFEDLPNPYITETPVHAGIECAASVRARFLAWTAAIEKQHPETKVIAVSHRDPIIVALLHWTGRGLEEVSGFDLAPGGVYEVRLTPGRPAVRRLGGMTDDGR